MLGRIVGLGCLFACVVLISLLSVFFTPKPKQLAESFVRPETPICNEYAFPGIYRLLPHDHLSSTWQSYAPLPCPKAPNLLVELWRYTSFLPDSASSIPPELLPLVNNTVLLIGDSVDRNALQQLSGVLGIPYRQTSYDDPINGATPPDWDPRNVPHVLEIPTLSLTFISVFFYGLDDISEFSVQRDWHPPGLAEDRVDYLFAPLARKLKIPPTFILLHSGLWDLAFFGRRDQGLGVSLDEPLSHDRVQWFLHRFRTLVDHVQAQWPDTPLWIRKAHRIGDQFYASHDFSHGIQMGEGFVNFFTNIRAAQVRDLEEQVARERSLPVFDFGRIWEGWQHYQDKVHPRPYPGTVMFNQPLLHFVWMETQGRHRWVDNQS